MELDHIWQQTLDYLRSQMTKATYEATCQRTRLLSANGSIIIETPNPTAKDWLENRLSDTLARALSEASGQPVTKNQLTFIVAEARPIRTCEPDVPIHIRSKRKERRYWLDNEFIDQGYAAHVGPAAVAVYNLLCRRADNDSQQSWPGKCSIASDLGLSKNTVKMAIRQLAACNLVVVKQNFRPGTREHESNTYTLTDVSEWVRVWEMESI